MTRAKALLLITPLVLCVLLLLLLPLMLDKDKIVQLAAAAIKERSGVTLTVAGAIELDLIPRIGVSLADVSLTMPAPQQTVVQVRSMQLGLQLLPLFAGEMEVDTLHLDGLVGRIAAGQKETGVKRGAMSDAELDAFYAQRRETQVQAATTAGTRAVLALPLALNIQTLSLTDSQLELEDADGAATTMIELRRFEASNLNLGARPVTVEASIRLPAEQAIELELRATLRIDQQRQVVVLESVEADISEIARDIINTKANGEIDIRRQVADLQLALEIAGTQGEGTLRYAAFESPLIDATLHFTQFDPALLALTGPQAAAGTGGGADTGSDSLPLESLRAIDTRADLRIDRALLGGHAVENLHLALRAVDGILRVNSLTGKLYDGEIALEATLNGKHNTASLETRGTVTGLDIARALAATELGPAATGKADLEWKLASQGRTQTRLLANLKGPIRLTTAGLVLRDIGIEGLLCRAVALTNREALTASFPGSTRFDLLTADIKLANGKALLRPLKADLPYIQLRGKGRYDLLSRDFKATFKASLSPEIETLDRACRVSKRLTAIDWPVDCAGNAAGQPGEWCRVDTVEIIEDLGKNEAKRKLQKEAGKLLDGLFGN